ncbi:MAG: hypothetical protein IPF56_11780 [Chloroflexi bacterium]|nr:hypothetical protein [Chloroflexota bacterium]MBK6712145.1 hypothetical protein [Chloroflexota bacterium]MBK7178661.1 hypothetical protein [Chloroflexota bacterium]MBK8932118.1 hypothetical protein [Chloroflexota bacterium]
MVMEKAGKRPFWRDLVVWGILVVLLAAMVIVVVMAPAEQSLGSGIKVVYVHVALIWTGMALMLVNGLVGLAEAALARPFLERWRQAIGWVALGVFVLGVVVSLWAEQVNWGGVLWREPRNLAVFNVTAVAIIAQVLAGWLPQWRWRGLFATGLAAYLLWEIPRTPLVMHPSDPVRTSNSMGIQTTFYGLFALSLGTAVWLIWYVLQRQNEDSLAS